MANRKKFDIPNYFRNVGNSTKYAMKSILSDQMPEVANATRSAVDSTRYMKETFKNINTNIHNIKRNNEITTSFKNGAESLNKVANQLKSGNFYGSSSSNGDFNEEDFFGSDDFFDENMFDGEEGSSNDDDLFYSDKPSELSSITRSNNKSSNKGKTIIIDKSSNNNRASDRLNLDLTKITLTNSNRNSYMFQNIFNQMRSESTSNFNTLNSNMAKLISYTNDAINPFFERTTHFYDDLLTEVREQKGFINGLFDLQKKSYEEENNSNQNISDYDKVLGGFFDTQEYTKIIKKNIDEYVAGSIGMSLSDLKEMVFGSSSDGAMPGNKFSLSTLVESGFKAAISSFIPKSSKKNFSLLNILFGNFLPNLNDKLLSMKDDYSSPGATIKRLIGSVFGIEPDSKLSHDLSIKKANMKYNKRADYSLTILIPKLLGMIYSSVSGKEEPVFNYDTGRLITKEKTKKEYEKEKKNIVMSSYSDITNTMEGILKKTEGVTEEEIKDMFENYLPSAFEAVAKYNIRMKPGDDDSKQTIAQYTGNDKYTDILYNLLDNLSTEQKLKLPALNHAATVNLIKFLKEATNDKVHYNSVLMDNTSSEESKIKKQTNVSENLGNVDATKIEQGSKELRKKKQEQARKNAYQKKKDELEEKLRKLRESDSSPEDKIAKMRKIENEINSLKEDSLFFKLQDTLNDWSGTIENSSYGGAFNRLTSLITKGAYRGANALIGTDVPEEFLGMFKKGTRSKRLYKNKRNRAIVGEGTDGAEELIVDTRGSDATMTVIPHNRTKENEKTRAGNNFKTITDLVIKEIINPLSEKLFGDQDAIMEKLNEGAEKFSNLAEGTTDYLGALFGFKGNIIKSFKKFINIQIGKILNSKTVKGFQEQGIGYSKEVGNNLLDFVFGRKITKGEDGKTKFNKSGNDSVFSIVKSRIKNGIDYIFGGEESKEIYKKEAKGIFHKAKEKISNSFTHFTDVLFGEGKQKRELDALMSKGKGYFDNIKGIPKDLKGKGKNVAADATTGLLLSYFLPGGPIVGSIAGLTVGIVRNSESAKKLIFGDLVDENENDKSKGRAGGLIPKSIQDAFRKDLPDFAINAGAGLIGSMFLPGGPIIGGLLGVIGVNTLRKIDWKATLFGTKFTDNDGNVHTKRGLLSGAIDGIKYAIVNPVHLAFKKFSYGLLDTLQDKILYPLKKAKFAIGTFFKRMTASIYDGFKRKLIFPVSAFIFKKIKDSFIGKGVKKITGSLAKGARAIVSMPGKVIGGAADRYMRHVAMTGDVDTFRKYKDIKNKHKATMDTNRTRWSNDIEDLESRLSNENNELGENLINDKLVKDLYNTDAKKINNAIKKDQKKYEKERRAKEKEIINRRLAEYKEKTGKSIFEMSDLSEEEMDDIFDSDELKKFNEEFNERVKNELNEKYGNGTKIIESKDTIRKQLSEAQKKAKLEEQANEDPQGQQVANNTEKTVGLLSSILDVLKGNIITKNESPLIDSQNSNTKNELPIINDNPIDKVTATIDNQNSDNAIMEDDTSTTNNPIDKVTATIDNQNNNTKNESPLINDNPIDKVTATIDNQNSYDRQENSKPLSDNPIDKVTATIDNQNSNKIEEIQSPNPLSNNAIMEDDTSTTNNPIDKVAATINNQNSYDGENGESFIDSAKEAADQEKMSMFKRMTSYLGNLSESVSGRMANGKRNPNSILGLIAGAFGLGFIGKAISGIFKVGKTIYKSIKFVAKTVKNIYNFFKNAGGFLKGLKKIGGGIGTALTGAAYVKGVGGIANTARDIKNGNFNLGDFLLGQEDYAHGERKANAYDIAGSFMRYGGITNKVGLSRMGKFLGNRKSKVLQKMGKGFNYASEKGVVKAAKKAGSTIANSNLGRKAIESGQRIMNSNVAKSAKGFVNEGITKLGNTKIGQEVGSKAMNFVSNSKIAKEAAGSLIKDTGKGIASKAGNLIGNLLKSKPVQKIIGSEGVQKITQKVASKLGGKALGATGAKLLAKLGGPQAAIFLANDIITGMTDVKKILKLPPKSKPTMKMRITAGLARALSGFTFGILDEGWLTETIFKAIGTEKEEAKLAEMKDEMAAEAEANGMSVDDYNKQANKGFWQKIGGGIKKGAKAAFGALKYLNPVYAVSQGFKNLKKTGKLVKDSFEKLKNSEFGQNVSNIIGKAKDAAKGILNKINPINVLKNGLETGKKIGATINEKLSGLKLSINNPEELTNIIKKTVSFVSQFTPFGLLKKAFGTAKSAISSLFGIGDKEANDIAEGKGKKSNFFSKIGSTFKKGFNLLFNGGKNTDEGGEGGGYGYGSGTSSDTLNGLPYYSQADPRWASKKYKNTKGQPNGSGSDENIKNRGCGPAAMAMIGSAYSGQKITPDIMADMAEKQGYSGANGTSWNFIDSASAQMGLQSNRKEQPNPEDIAYNAYQGKPMILSGKNDGKYGNSAFTKKGHYVVTSGMTKDGKIKVNDPRGENYSKAYTPEELANQSGSAWNFGYGGDGVESTTETDSQKKARDTVIQAIKSREGKNEYTMGSKRNQVGNGYGDCSATVRWALLQGAGVDPGGNTGDQWTNKNGQGVDNTSGGPKESNLRLGDLLYYARPNSDYTKGRKDRVGHVEMYVGNGERMGHGSGIGPKRSPLNTDGARYIGAKRFIGADASAKELPSALLNGSSNNNSATMSSNENDSSSKSSSKKSGSSSGGLSGFLSATGKLFGSLFGGKYEKDGEESSESSSSSSSSTSSNNDSTSTGGASISLDSGNDFVGKYVAQFESGKKGSAMISSGKGDNGGVSFGTYQFPSYKQSVTSKGNLPAFWNKYFASKYPNVKPGDNEAFKNAWRTEAESDKNGFLAKEHDFMIPKYWEPMKKNVSSIVNIEDTDRAIQEAAWSTAVQYGPNSSVWKSAGLNSTMKPSDFINRLQDYKRDSVSTRYKSSSKAVQQSVANRHNTGERNVLLSLANKSGIKPKKVEDNTGNAGFGGMGEGDDESNVNNIYNAEITSRANKTSMLNNEGMNYYLETSNKVQKAINSNKLARETNNLSIEKIVELLEGIAEASKLTAAATTNLADKGINTAVEVKIPELYSIETDEDGNVVRRKKTDVNKSEGRNIFLGNNNRPDLGSNKTKSSINMIASGI